MIGKILCAGVLSAALILLPNPNSGEHVKNSETKAVVGGTSGQMRQQQLLTDKDDQQVAKLQATTPAQGSGAKQEKPESQPEAAIVQTSVKASEPEPQQQGCEKYRSLVSKYDWNVNIALAVMQAENGCKPGGPASSTCDRGLMQINCVHADMVNSLDDLYDPATNISVAYKVYLGRKQQTGNGWLAWNAYKNGSYRKFL